MPKKHTKEYVRSVIERKGGRLVGKYVNSTTKI